MKNVTITLEEDVLRWAKIRAASEDTSVSRMLGEELRRQMLTDQSYELAKKRFQTRAVKPLKSSNATYPSRESLYER
jgi:hypothetical protein